MTMTATEIKAFDLNRVITAYTHTLATLKAKQEKLTDAKKAKYVLLDKSYGGCYQLATRNGVLAVGPVELHCAKTYTREQAESIKAQVKDLCEVYHNLSTIVTVEFAYEYSINCVTEILNNAQEELNNLK